MSEERFCQCGRALSKFGGSRSSLCRQCRERNEQEKLAQKRSAKRLGREAVVASAGMVLLHTCLSSPFDAPKECACRKLIAKAQASEMVVKEGAIDFENRKPIFANRAILAAVRFKQPPISTLGGRVGMDRAITGDKPPLTGQEIERLRAIAAEDRMWRSLERRSKVAIENELAISAMRSITIVVDEDEWLKDRDDAEGIPVIQLPVGIDERSSIGRDVASFANVEMAA
jgi:hypothetical protein